MLQIPITKNGDSKARITLDGVTYLFKTKYNSRNERIYLDIQDKYGNDLLTGLRLVEDVVINSIYTRGSSGDLPSGYMVVQQIDTTLEDSFATLGNLGIDQPFIFVYLSESDFEEE